MKQDDLAEMEKAEELEGGADSAMLSAGARQSETPNIPPELQDKIIIRTPVLDDREPGRALCKAAFADTLFAEAQFSDKKYDRIFGRLVALPPDSVGLGAELNGELVGVAWASIGSPVVGEGVAIASVHAIVIDQTRLGPLRRAKTFLLLVRALRAWATKRNAKRFFVHVTTAKNLASVHKLLRAAGLSCVGGNYVA